jgi:hypothetical protein
VKKQDVRTGATYLAKVSGQVVPVKIVQEKWRGDQHTGWVGTNTETGRSVYIKSAQRLRALVRGAEGEAPAKATKIEPPVPAHAGDVGHGGVPSEPVGTSAVAATPVPPAATSGGKAKKSKGGGKARGGQKGKKTKAKQSAKNKPLSALGAAAAVLAQAKKPMRVSEILAEMEAKNLWKSKAGKTPEATIYAAIIREIRDKGVDSRFEKKDRGLFAAAGK